jgi:replicative DNA helicase
MHPADPRVPRHQQVEWDVKGMKEIARELNIAVVCLAQVKRDVDNRDGEDRLPRMSDLGDSGSIEREADVILTLYREHAYGKPIDANGRPLNIPDYGLLGVVKNRHGLNGEVPIQYIGDRLQFLERPQLFQME